MRPLLRNTVELPGPALAPGPAAHKPEIAPIGVHIHGQPCGDDKQGFLPEYPGTVTELCYYGSSAVPETMGE